MDGLKQSGSFAIETAQLARHAHRIFAPAGPSKAEVAETIRATLAATGYLLDPHTATGIHVADTHPRSDVPMVMLATAHPAKFPAAVDQASGVTPELPDWLGDLMARKERFTVLPSEIKMVEDLSRPSLAGGALRSSAVHGC